MDVSMEDELVSRTFKFVNGQWELGRGTYIMGILNMTPDSFSDGGAHNSGQAMRGLIDRMIASGTAVIDIGGESTRPGYKMVTAHDEWMRIMPALDYIRAAYPHIPISIDTQKPEVAENALRAGAHIINDINGFSNDMLSVVQGTRAGLVMMFNRMPAWSAGEVCLEEIQEFFHARIGMAARCGISADHIVVDPGLGFGYGIEDNWDVLRNLRVFEGYGVGLLVGPSRKRFIGQVTGKSARDRDYGTAAVVALSIAQGADIVRVHAVEEMRDVVKTADRWVYGELLDSN